MELTPDVVVLDSVIERENDGIQIAKRILSRRRLTKIVLLVDMSSKIEKKDERIGIELFVKKGVGVQKISDSICGILELRKSSFDLIAE